MAFTLSNTCGESIVSVLMISFPPPLFGVNEAEPLLFFFFFFFFFLAPPSLLLLFLSPLLPSLWSESSSPSSPASSMQPSWLLSPICSVLFFWSSLISLLIIFSVSPFDFEDFLSFFSGGFSGQSSTDFPDLESFLMRVSASTLPVTVTLCCRESISVL